SPVRVNISTPTRSPAGVACITVATEELAKQPDWATTARQLAPRSAPQPTHTEEDELANLHR
ncbi:MAG: hypothetical protein J2P17_07160, partial [Mycobacterium sp.]|nr:hypothetical protein [Mycobacterium sp.]